MKLSSMKTNEDNTIMSIRAEAKIKEGTDLIRIHFKNSTRKLIAIKAGPTMILSQRDHPGEGKEKTYRDRSN